MTAISIHIEKNAADSSRFRAVAGSHQSVGRTAGEALDSLNADLGDTESGSLIIVHQLKSDPYFSELKNLRMKEILDNGDTLTELEQDELVGLVKEELIASAKRTEALADALGR